MKIIMNSLNKFNTKLKQKGFCPAQIKKLQDQFGHLDAAGLLRTPPDQLLPIVNFELRN